MPIISVSSSSVLRIATIGLALAGLAACGPNAPIPATKARYTAVNVAAIPGWQQDETVGEALFAYQRSCNAWSKANPDKEIGKGLMKVTAANWQARCADAMTISSGDPFAAREFFSRAFTPMKVEPIQENPSNPWGGLVTGYYEPLLFGSRQCGGRYTTPLYRTPSNPTAYDRAAVNRGALAGKGLEIVCVDDPVGAFFLEIQGSGRVALEDGSMMQLGYAAQNGQEYVPIGRILKQEGKLDPKDVSLFTIRNWLKANPSDAKRIMEENPSYVFFKERTGDGPIGAQGVPLTSQRSLAVDPRFAPYGAPIFLQTTLPGKATGATADAPLNRLFIAQDTGGAIKGPARADLFFGFEPPAEALAGYMKQKGEFYVFLPQELATKINGRIVE